MTFQPDAVFLLLLFLVTVTGVVLALFYVKTLLQARREKRRMLTIKYTLIDYFRKSGVEVSVNCTQLVGEQCYIAVIESEPMKRFRLSHIIEMTLREHVRKASGLELGKVYWRFPIKEAVQHAAAQENSGAKPEKPEDEYINEGLEHYRHIPTPEVTELPWEHFAEVASVEPEKKTATQQ